jgi:HK97 family phage portal protein
MPGWSPDRPLSLVDKASLAIGLEISLQERQARLFGGAASPGGKLKLPPTVGKEKAEELISAFVTRHAGPKAAGNILALYGGMEFEDPAPLNLLDQQFLELRRFSVVEIARVFKVSPVLIGDLERAVFKNTAELAQQFLTYTLLPWIEIWIGALTRSLLTPAERNTHFIEFIVEDLLRADIAARFKAFKEATGSSWQTPNETRRLEQLPPIEGGDELVRQAGQTGASDGDGDDDASNLRLVE